MIKFLRLNQPHLGQVSRALNSALPHVSFFFMFHRVVNMPQYLWVLASSSSGISFPHVPGSTMVTKESGWADWLRRRSHAPDLKVEVESQPEHMKWHWGRGRVLPQYSTSRSKMLYTMCNWAFIVKTMNATPWRLVCGRDVRRHSHNAFIFKKSLNMLKTL